ncbi:hypothetical protein MGN70_008684 [Eutypa lata]|nr:hypothetical protein MGN70_008684 [Eutypa lata]
MSYSAPSPNAYSPSLPQSQSRAGGCLLRQKKSIHQFFGKKSSSKYDLDTGLYTTAGEGKHERKRRVGQKRRGPGARLDYELPANGTSSSLRRAATTTEGSVPPPPPPSGNRGRERKRRLQPEKGGMTSKSGYDPRGRAEMAKASMNGKEISPDAGPIRINFAKPRYVHSIHLIMIPAKSLTVS